MSFDYLSEYQTTAVDNTAVGSVNIQENCAPSVINNAIREVMSHLAGYKAETVAGAAVASATALLVNIPGVTHSVTGTTTITSLADPTNDTSNIKILSFAGALTFTHSASLILPGAANITTVPGDVAYMVYEGSSVWRCVSFLSTAAQKSTRSQAEALTSDNVLITPLQTQYAKSSLLSVSKSSTATLTADDLGKLIVLSGASFTLTLPDTTASNIDTKIVTFYSDSGNTYQIAPDASDTIDKVSGNFYLAGDGGSLILKADAANTRWVIIGGQFTAPKVYAYRDTSTQSITQNSTTLIQLNAKGYDNWSNFDSTTNYRFTPKLSGFYKVSVAQEYTAMTDGKTIITSIYKNGSSVARVRNAAAATQEVGDSLSFTVSMNGTTDYIDLRTFQNDTAPQAIQNGASITYLTAEWVGF